MRPIRWAVALSMLLAGVTVAPAAGFEEMIDNGKTGSYIVKDKAAKPGVVCKFEDRSGKIDDELNKIKVGRVKTYGQRKGKRWVGYRFSVLQRSWPSTDYEFVFKSRFIKQQASKTMRAAFPGRTWVAPEDLPASDFRVLITFTYYKKGSKTQVEGKVRGVMEVHRHKHPDAPSFLIGKPGSGGECFYNFWT